jgi:hypothetical protein
MSVLKLPLLVDRQQNVGELVLAVNSCPIIICELSSLLEPHLFTISAISTEV